MLLFLAIFLNIKYPYADAFRKSLKTLIDVLQHWDHSSLWGWDYPMLAMVASKLGDFNLTIKILLDDNPKNTYLINGNNYQTKDLPLYLLGNGDLMLAMVRLATDFPDKITCENVTKWPW